MLKKSLSMLDDSVVLVTGGTGSFGKAFTNYLLEKAEIKKLILFSRGELGQSEFKTELEKTYPDKVSKVRFFIGDVRDKERLHRAFKGVDYVIHAAALKQVPACEYNPSESIKTNVTGTQNVVEVAIDEGVKKVIFLSTDKACSPVNTYGKSKAIAESLVVAGNNYAHGYKRTVLACTRYGNVIGSRGSVIPVFKKQAESGVITITDTRMTRFWLTLEEGVEFVLTSLYMAKGGEIFIPIIPSMKITDLAMAVAPLADWEETGIRPGEKLHEIMVSEDEARHSVKCKDRYIILPEYHDWTGHINYGDGKILDNGFTYSSDNNTQWLSIDTLKNLL